MKNGKKETEGNRSDRMQLLFSNTVCGRQYKSPYYIGRAVNVSWP